MSAVLSGDGQYRYTLRRQGWLGGDGTCLFIMLNPSTADATEDDPTIRRCIGFTKDWGYAELLVANLFAYRATNPRDLDNVYDPIGPDNDEWTQRLYDESAIAVAAWGADPAATTRAAVILERYPDLQCLGTTQGGSPKHPLYLSADLVPVEYSPEARK